MKSQIKRAFVALLMLVMCLVANAQKTITGTVKDTMGEPMIGVSVIVDGTTVGGVTDFNGNFTIQKAPNNAVLKFSYVGYKDKKVSTAGKQSLNVVLEEDAMGLDEVVVVGYGTMKKKDLTGSVASIKPADIASVAAPNAMQAMQAKVPGLDLTQSNGQAGAGVNMTLRGNRSISASNNPLIIVDGVEYGSTLDIPANDIESMDILKDASSTAIYGTKGANGVIIITTKRGKAGKTRVDFSAYLAFKSPTSMVKGMYGMKEVQRFVDRANYQADLASGNWGSSNLAWGDLTDWLATDLPDGTQLQQSDVIADGSFTDWYDTIMRNSTTQNYEASVSGGNEKTNFNFSLAAMFDKGLLKRDQMDRYNARLNVDHNLNKVVKVGANMGFTYKDHDRRFALFNSARKMTSITHAYDQEGNIIQTPNPMYPAHVNPLMDESDNFQNNVETIRFLGSAYLQLNPIKNLFLKSQFAVDRTDARTGMYTDYQSVGQYQNAGPSQHSNMRSASTTITWQNTANYNLDIDKHALGFLLGHELSQTVNEAIGVTGSSLKEHFYTGSFYDMTKVTSPVVNDGNNYYTKKSLLSFFGRVNYTFADRYLFTATLRADGASPLAEGHKWGYFPSVAAGWRVTEEKFMEGTKTWLDNLKLRLSWGKSGNAAINPYQTLATLSPTIRGTEMIPMSMSNPDLSWETTTAIDLGIDFGILGGRINGTIDYYWSKTNDLLYPKSAPASSVYTSVLSNVGKTKGQGLEISLNALAVKTQDFAWDINATYTHATDEVVELADGLEQNILGYNNALIVGEPVNIFYTYEVAGNWGIGEYAAFMAANPEFQAPDVEGYGDPGTAKIVDINGDNKIDENDRRVYQRSPKHIFGLTNTFTYRDFSLSIQAMARLGGYMNFERNALLGLDDNNANWADVDYWTVDNQGAFFPNPGSNPKVYSVYKDAYRMEKADFFKIKDITLSYNLPKSIISKAYMSNAKVYCSLKNYLTWSSADDYDSEVGGSINWPLAKQVVVGVNVSF
ncbi:MAG: SusC/RagA family TonB-linked outer membrane protein [Prevotella sp.]